MRCDQCEMLSINGVPCHETGCPNSSARWDAESEEWIKQTECWQCGCMVDCDSRGEYECDCQDRESYTDDQDRENYTIADDDDEDEFC